MRSESGRGSKRPLAAGRLYVNSPAGTTWWWVVPTEDWVMRPPTPNNTHTRTLNHIGTNARSNTCTITITRTDDLHAIFNSFWNELTSGIACRS